MAKVSIVIPVYNVEKYLSECLNSVQNQTLKDIEIICVDDGSTDSSGEILDEYADKDERFRVIHKQNEGYGKAVNVGLEVATAPYVGIVESDDMVKPHMYESLLALMEEKRVDVIKADFYEFYEDEEGKYIEEYVPLNSNENLNGLYNKVFNIREHEEAFFFHIYSWSGLYDRTFLQREHIVHNETPGASYQDQGFWFQTMIKAKSIYFAKQAFYRYRVDNPNSSMYSKAKVFTVFEEYDFVRAILEQMGEEGKRFFKWTSYLKISNGIYNVSRVADEYKEALAQRIKEEFLLSLQRGEVDAGLYNNDLKVRIFDILSNPPKYVDKEVERRKKIEDTVRDYEVVILYGAGKIGRKAQQILKEGRVNTKVKYFAVSEVGQNPDTVLGIPVRQIDELLAYRESALVIISVGKQNEQEVENILRNRHFNHTVMFRDMI